MHKTWISLHVDFDYIRSRIVIVLKWSGQLSIKEFNFCVHLSALKYLRALKIALSSMYACPVLSVQYDFSGMLLPGPPFHLHPQNT